jgi:hypothetical protein
LILSQWFAETKRASQEDHPVVHRHRSRHVDERSIDSSVDPKDLPEEESRLKAYTVHALYPNDQVLPATPS